MTVSISVHLYGQRAATLEFMGPGDYRLSYLREWQESAGLSISLSLPVTQRVHSGRVVSDFLDNLLPDSVAVREEWARQSGLDDAEPFGLLAVHGADVAGALEFYPEGQAHSAVSRTPVGDDQIAERIRAIRENRPVPLAQDGPGQFSLGGAQGKFALARRDERWFDATGAAPSTHIFKPQVAGLIDGEIIEHITMSTLPLLGLPAAETSMASFADEHTLQVKRFDRVDDTDYRIHQEDFSQALGIPRLRKYEKDGGPGYRTVLSLLDRIPDTSISASAKDRFVRSLILSWMILNTDAHAKNYSLRLLPDSIDLAPAYDTSSLLPYVNPRDDTQPGLREAFDRTPLSMRVADSYDAGAMSRFEWESVARDARLDVAATLEWASLAAQSLPLVFRAVAETLEPRYRTDTVELLLERMDVRSQQVVEILDRPIDF